MLTDGELQERAFRRRGASPCRIGAARARELTEPGRDGRLWEVVITDGEHGYRVIEVLAPRVLHDAEIEPEQVEALVEQQACEYRSEFQLDAMANASPLRIELYPKGTD